MSIYVFLWCFDTLRESCSDWYDWFCWLYYDIRLMYVICSYLAIYPEIVTTVTTSFTSHKFDFIGFSFVSGVLPALPKF